MPEVKNSALLVSFFQIRIVGLYTAVKHSMQFNLFITRNNLKSSYQYGLFPWNERWVAFFRFFFRVDFRTEDIQRLRL